MEPSTNLYTDTCSICYDTLKTNITLSCKHVFCYLCIKTVIQTNNSMGEDSSCPLCREPIDGALLENASGDIDTLPSRNENFAWMYEGRKGGWWYYQSDHNAQIEEGYQKYIDVQNMGSGGDVVIMNNMVNIEVCSKPYTINFETMQQYQSYQANVVGNGYYRNIKRVDKFELDTSKGVAGVKYNTSQNK